MIFDFHLLFHFPRNILEYNHISMCLNPDSNIRILYDEYSLKKITSALITFHWLNCILIICWKLINLFFSFTGTTPFASYTPTSINSSFELGITRTPSPLVNNITSSSSSSKSTNGNVNGTSTGLNDEQNNENGDSLQYLKPATDEQTVAWSEGTRATDLLF